MKRTVVGLFLGAAGLAVALLDAGTGGGSEPVRQAARDWVDLFPGKDLQGWKRVPIAPDTKLNAKNPWKVNVADKVLECDGVGVKEMLLQDAERTDGVFHVEWRFRKVTGKGDYNAGVYVRTSSDGKVWHQAQVAHPDKPPRLGDLFGETRVDGRLEHFEVQGKGTKLAHPPGEWNTYDITCKGPKITVTVNGTVATTWDRCQVRRGHVGLQAEYFFIEFRNLKYRPLD